MDFEISERKIRVDLRQEQYLVVYFALADIFIDLIERQENVTLKLEKDDPLTFSRGTNFKAIPIPEDVRLVKETLRGELVNKPTLGRLQLLWRQLRTVAYFPPYFVGGLPLPPPPSSPPRPAQDCWGQVRRPSRSMHLFRHLSPHLIARRPWPLHSPRSSRRSHLPL